MHAAIDPGKRGAHNRLISFASNTYSSEGEDGILAHIFAKLGVEQGWCVEVGAGDGTTPSPTRHLIKQGWSALLFEGDPDRYPRLQAHYDAIECVHCIYCTVSFTGRNTLDQLLGPTSIPKEFDLLSIDIAGADWYVWESLSGYRPRVICIGYNPSIPNEVDFVQKKRLNIHQGASLAACIRLGKQKGYELVAVTPSCALFVPSEDLAAFDIEENNIDAMRAPGKAETYLVQGYDSYLHYVGNRRLLALGTYLPIEHLQAFPKPLRFFKSHSLPKLALRRLWMRLRGMRRRRRKKAKIVPHTRGQHNHLASYASNRTSQRGEDGILAHIFEILGVETGWSVECGAGDGITLSNTYQLLEKGWSGVMIEADPLRFAGLEKRYAGQSRIHCLQRLVSLEGENTFDRILASTPIPKAFDFLSLDIDGVDWYVWESLHEYRPRVICIEYNPTIPNGVDFVQERNMEIQHGCSLTALIRLGKKKGYELVAVTPVNGIFVRKEDFPLFKIEDNSLDAMRSPGGGETFLFQGYDGALYYVGCRALLWAECWMPLNHMQALPKALRFYESRSKTKRALRRLWLRMHRG